MAGISIRELFNLNIIQQIQDSFSMASGMAAVVTDADGKTVTEYSGCRELCEKYVRCSEKGFSRCTECAKEAALNTKKFKKPYIYKCHVGFYNFAVPIMAKEQFIGCIIGGQVMCEEFDDDFFRMIADEIGVDASDFISDARKIRIEDMNKVKSGAKCLYTLANALSDMSYSNYQMLRKVDDVERGAKLRSGYVTQNLLNEIKAKMNEWLYNSKEILGYLDGSNADSIVHKISSDAENVYYSVVKNCEQGKEDSKYLMKISEKVYSTKSLFSIFLK